MCFLKPLSRYGVNPSILIFKITFQETLGEVRPMVRVPRQGYQERGLT